MIKKKKIVSLLKDNEKNPRLPDVIINVIIEMNLILLKSELIIINVPFGQDITDAVGR
jgi:hypothetical protein